VDKSGLKNNISLLKQLSFYAFYHSRKALLGVVYVKTLPASERKDAYANGIVSFYVPLKKSLQYR